MTEIKGMKGGSACSQSGLGHSKRLSNSCISKRKHRETRHASRQASLPGALTQLYVLLAGVVDGHAHRECVLVVLGDGKLRSAGVFQQPQLPVHLHTHTHITWQKWEKAHLVFFASCFHANRGTLSYDSLISHLLGCVFTLSSCLAMMLTSIAAADAANTRSLRRTNQFHSFIHRLQWCVWHNCCVWHSSCVCAQPHQSSMWHR